MCPVWGKTCAACGERNHFKASRRCKRQSFNSLAEDYSSDSPESSTGTISVVAVSEDQVVHSVNPGNQLIFCEMEINKRPVRMQVDFGATVISFQSTTWGKCLFVLNKTSLSALGKCKVNVKNPTTSKEYKVDFVIVDNNNTPLFSGVAAQKINLISVHYDKFKAVNVVTQDSHKYFEQFPDAFKDTPGTWEESPLDNY